MRRNGRPSWIWTRSRRAKALIGCGRGSDCSWPSESRCMLFLSDGGEDAITAREYDLKAKQFVPGGFTLPKAKQRTAWESEDSLLVAREWSADELTTSGYPFVVKRLRRGQPLSDAVEVFRGSKSDGGYGVTPIALHDGAGHQATIIARPLSTFNAEYYLVTESGPTQTRRTAAVAARRAGCWAAALHAARGLECEWVELCTGLPRFTRPRRSNRRSRQPQAEARLRARTARDARLRRTDQFADTRDDLRKRPRARVDLRAGRRR